MVHETIQRCLQKRKKEPFDLWRRKCRLLPRVRGNIYSAAYQHVRQSWTRAYHIQYQCNTGNEASLHYWKCRDVYITPMNQKYFHSFMFKWHFFASYNDFTFHHYFFSYLEELYNSKQNISWIWPYSLWHVFWMKNIFIKCQFCFSNTCKLFLFPLMIGLSLCFGDF